MLKFLKKYFKTEKEVVEVDFYELNKWVSEDLNPHVEKILSNISENLKLLEISATELNNIKLEKANVEKRVKQTILGNKDSFVRSIKGLIKTINPPQSFDLISLKQYSEKLTKELNKFNEKTQRNFYIMKSIINEELNKVAVILKELNELSKILKNLSKENGKYDVYESLLENIKNLYVYFDEEDARKNQAGKIDSELDEYYKKLKDVEKQIENLRKSDLFKKKQVLEKKKDQLNKKEYDLVSKFKMKFYLLERPLKKYQKIEKNKLLKRYLDDPFNTFIKDQDYELIQILNGLKKSIKTKKIDLKNSNKIINYIDFFTKNMLQSIKEDLQNIEKERNKVMDDLSNNKFEETKENLLKKLKDTQTKINELSMKKSNIEDKNIKKELEDIENLLKKLSDKKIVIKNAPLVNQISS